MRILMLCLIWMQCDAMEVALHYEKRHMDVSTELGKCSFIGSHYVGMRLFHEVYIVLCRAHCGGREFFEGYVDPVDGIRKSAYNDFDPPSAENGNKTLYERYQEWLRITGFPEPQNGIG